MRAGSVVVVGVLGKDATQMPLVEDHNVIKTFTTNRTDHAFDMRILPW